MIPSNEEIEALHRKYARSDAHFQRVYVHCQIVAQIAQDCMKVRELVVASDIVIAASLLHDIGAYMLLSEEGEIDRNYYQLHGTFGAKLLEDEGIDSRICAIVETHALPVISKRLLAERPIPFPAKDFSQKSLEAELVCYADRFHSKGPQFNSLQALESKMVEYPEKLRLFREWQNKFGMPDLAELSKVYGHPIK